MRCRSRCFFRRPAPAFLCAGLAAVFAWGCANGPVSSALPLGGPAAWRIAGIPFVPGEPGACGPAALSSLLAFRGDPVSVDEIASALAVPSLSGVLPLDLLRFAAGRAPQIEARTVTGSLPWLREEVARDRPVVAFLDLGRGPWRQGHFVVVVGYRDDSGEVLLYSGRDPSATMPFARFARAWERGGWWALVITSADPRERRA